MAQGPRRGSSGGASRGSSGSWSREGQPDLAVERILDAAEKAFVEVGVSAAGMAEIAEAAGCSRGTLYRYFKTRHDLHLAYVKRAGLAIGERIVTRTAGIADPRERMLESILCAVREVRANPGTAAWFERGASGMAARMSQSSEVLEALTGAFRPRLMGLSRKDPEGELRARWIVRVILSLLANPAESEAEERAMLERFVVPGLLAPAGS